MLGDSTIKVKITRAFLDLDSIHAGSEVNVARIALDDNLFVVGCVSIPLSKLQPTVVALNHQLGDFSEGKEI